MAQSFARRLVAVGASLMLALALPGLAAATVEGPCQVTGSSSSGGSIDLNTATEWHMNSTDTAGGSGTATAEQTNASVGAYALGIRLPIAQGSGEGGTSGSVEGVSVELYAILGKHFVVAGSSTGKDGPGCSGEVDIILDDVHPLFTLFGGGGLLATLIAVIVLIALARGDAGCFGRILGGVFGGLGGLGLALALEQFDIFDPQAPLGLVVLIAALVLGLWTPGMLARGPVAPAE